MDTNQISAAELLASWGDAWLKGVESLHACLQTSRAFHECMSVVLVAPTRAHPQGTRNSFILWLKCMQSCHLPFVVAAIMSKKLISSLSSTFSAAPAASSILELAIRETKLSKNAWSASGASDTIMASNASSCPC